MYNDSLINDDNVNFVVVIRSAGERTTELCQKIVSKQISEESIHVINEVPFESALKKCYQIGIASDKKWMITIDADILPVKSMICDLSNHAKNMSDDVIMFSGLVYDKFLFKYRRAGLRVYRTKYLKEALSYIPEDGVEIRPENYTINVMVSKGCKKEYTETVTAIHDFEQYYRDIYRTCFIHAVKHPEVFKLLKKWQKISEQDFDFKVAIKGALDGYLNSSSAKIDKRIFKDLSNLALKDIGLNEKKELNSIKMDEYVNKVLKAVGPYERITLKHKIIQKINDKGVYKGLQYISGAIIEKIGKNLKSNT